MWVIDAVRVMNRVQTEGKGIRPIKMSGGNDLSYYTYLKTCVIRFWLISNGMISVKILSLTATKTNIIISP